MTLREKKEKLGKEIDRARKGSVKRAKLVEKYIILEMNGEEKEMFKMMFESKPERRSVSHV